ncbi:hypothetical protein [Methylibium sp.]|uniref:hypothetical protein n=1 Tax=Methylibium sp. TaxID=2067992 RepID=UPI003D0E5A95
MTDDLPTRRAGVLAGTGSASAEIEQSLRHATCATVAPAFLKINAGVARATAAAVESALRPGPGPQEFA